MKLKILQFHICFHIFNTIFQCVYINDLRVKLCIKFCKIFHRFVEEENKVYICCNNLKKYVVLRQELVMSQNTKFRLWQPHGL